MSGGFDARRALARGLLGLALGVALVVALAAVVASLGSGEGLWSVISRAGPLRLVGAVLLISLSMPAVAMRWRALLPVRANPVVLTGILCTGLVFNYALPGPVGELAAASMAKRRFGVGFADALASLAASRILGLASACLLAGGVYLVAPMPVPDPLRPLVAVGAWVLVLGAGALISGAALPWLPGAAVEAVRPVAERLPGALGRGARRVLSMAQSLGDALVRTTRRGVLAWLESLGWALAGHLAVASGITLAAWSMGLDPAWSGVVFTYAVATAAAVLLFLFPGSHVGWDLSFGALLVLTTGVGAGDAAALAVVARVQQSLVLLVGVLALWAFAGDLLPGGAPDTDE